MKKLIDLIYKHRRLSKKVKDNHNAYYNCEDLYNKLIEVENQLYKEAKRLRKYCDCECLL